MKKAKVISEIAQRIRAGYKPEKIVLYGSYANGKSTKDSDIDILVVKKTNASSMNRYLKVRRLLRELESLERHIDISPIIRTPKEIKKRIEMGDDFIKDILASGIVLYDKKENRISRRMVYQRH